LISLFFVGTAIGMILSSVITTLALIVDKRHSSSDYANVFAIFESGAAISFMLGQLFFIIFSRIF
jgi:hypothetical protein